MIHGGQGFVLRESERLCVSQPNQKRSDESGTARGGNAIDAVEIYTSVSEGLIHDRPDLQEMFTRR